MDSEESANRGYDEKGRFIKGRASNSKGVPMSEDAKAKMREAWTRRLPASEETRRKISASNKGKVQSESARAKISAAKLGVPKSEQAKANMRIARSHQAPFSEETKARMSKAHKASEPKSPDHLLKIRVAKLSIPFGGDVAWIESFENLDKFIYVKQITCSALSIKNGFDVQVFKGVIEHFYYDENFNKLYDLWMSTGDRWIKPSIDHMIPRSRGGSNNLNNLQIISWQENQSKHARTKEEWDEVKRNLDYYFS